MAAIALSDWSFATKDFYRDNMPEIELGMSPLLDKLAHDGGWVGSQNYKVPITFARGQGTGASFATAQGDVSSIQGLRPTITSVKSYGFVLLEHEALTFADGEGVPLRMITAEVNGVRKQMTADLCNQLYNIGGGARGRRTSISSNTVTLTNKWDTVNFYKGMTVGASANENGSSPRVGDTPVTHVSHKAGTVTLANAASIASFTNNDFLFRAADLAAGTTKCLTGLGSPYDTTSTSGWLPCADPTAGDSFFGVDRSVQPESMAGWRVTDTTLPVDEALQDAGAYARMFSSKIDFVVCNPITFANQIKTSSSKIFRDQGGEVVGGNSGWTVLLPTGTVSIMTDPFCPTGRIYGLDTSSWHLKYAGSNWVEFMETDGLIWRRKESSADFECTMVSYRQLYCTEPGHNFVVLTAAA